MSFLSCFVLNLNMAASSTNLLGMSWQDHVMAPHINRDNVLDYFSQRSNCFYDVTCNNEICKMQKMGLQKIQTMIGIEYVLIHHQEPILYIIRKQKRLSPRQVQTLADYYIIAGTVYQSPDLGSIVNSRLMTTLHHLDSAFKETRGHFWNNDEELELKNKQKSDKKTNRRKEEQQPSMFQYSRADALLASLSGKYPFVYAKAETSDQQPVQISGKKSEKRTLTDSNVHSEKKTKFT